MNEVLVDVRTTVDGSVVVQPHGVVSAESAVQLRQILVHAMRRLRPHRLILDLGDVRELDSISVGTVAAVCALAVGNEPAVLVTNSNATIVAHLSHAGVHHRHLPGTPPVAVQRC